MSVRALTGLSVVVVLVVSCGLSHAAETDELRHYAESLLAGAEKDAELRLVKDIDHREGFRIQSDRGSVVVEAATGAGLMYGAQAVTGGGYESGKIEEPDFDVRGTTLWLGGAVQGRRIAPYHSGFNSETLPWFFDRPFMTRYLDKIASARFNTLFLWASHPFPFFLDLPEYPGATRLRSEQLIQNQKQFRWFVSECDRRNIGVLLHFYNIHLPDGLREQFGAHASWGASAVKNPSPEIARYYRYVLKRYFEEFDNVGLYICPGETLATSRQLEWFRDVIFKAAQESGKNPLLVIRDWTLNMDFRDQIPALYENCYSELKHNDESFTSPVPDRRHTQWRGLLKGHIVNLHGPPMDLQPMRWASPVIIHETVTNWRDMGYVKGAEIYALSCFDWPYTQDKLTVDQFGYRQEAKGPKLLWIDRSGIYLDVFGRYLWKTARTQEDERAYWEQYLTEKFDSAEVGKQLYRWYVLSGPISPGMQNLTATKFGNFWATAMLQNQDVDQILAARKRIDDVPITLRQEAGRTKQIYYSQPVDDYFFQRYKKRYGLPELTERISMPVTEYAEALSEGREVTRAMTPDKVCDLLCELADEAMESAQLARAAANNREAKAELGRFVTDGEMYVLATRALRAKVCAAILKGRVLQGDDADLGSEFLRHMEESLEIYENLAQLTDRTYRNANDLMGRHWKTEGLKEFRGDVKKQQSWLKKGQNACTLLDDGSLRIEAEDMQGPWRIGTDKYTGYEGTGYAASFYASAESEPTPMTLQVEVKDAGEYSVWVRALKGGAHQDRALAMEVADQRLKPTHKGQGPQEGVFFWEKAGTVKLETGRVELKIHPVGKKHPTADVIALTPGADSTVRCVSPGDTAYYVDAVGGDDANPGITRERAWKTLAPIHAMTLAPGDKILLKAGCEFAGPLHPQGVGAKGKPILVDKYGHGANPIINGEGKTENTIRLHNQSFWEIRNLTVSNTDGGSWDDEGRALRRAVYVTAEDAGDVNHIHLQGLEIRDVRGMYRFEGSQTNGGIICRVTGNSKKTRFVDLRIEDCVFHTKSIDRYPVVVTSSWGNTHPGEIVYRTNTLDHAGRAHIVIPAEQWPRKLVYYFDPEVGKVFPLEKGAAPISPFTGRVGCEDIFSEMAARLKRSWSFFEATRYEEGRWLFKMSAKDEDYSLWATGAMALGYYGELRALGFEPPWVQTEDKIMDDWINEVNKYLDPETNLLNGPDHGSADKGNMGYLSHSYDWQLRNRVFMTDRYTLPPGGLHGGDPLPTKEAAIESFNNKPWDTNPYGACNAMGKEMKSHREVLRAAGKDEEDEVVQMLHEMIDAKFVDGHWGKQGSPDGNMKMLVSYSRLDWPIPDHKKLIDYTLSFATEEAGFAGRGCHSFNQMFSLTEARRQHPDGYRGDEIDRYTAMTFITFLNNWDENLNFYSSDWNGKHNNGVPLYMPHLMLDLPIMRCSTVYNWRETPVITRDKEGHIKRNKVIHHTKGFRFHG